MGEPRSCPDLDAVQRLLASDYGEPEARWLEEHLARCSHCLDAVKALRTDDGLVEAARGAGVAEILGEPVDDALLDRLYRLRPSGTPGSGATQVDTPHRTGWDTQADLPAGEEHDFLPPPEVPGEIGRLAGYRVLRLLGAGGQGIVLEAEDPRLQRRVALKVMRPLLAASASARKRFLREARGLAAIRHDHVVPIYEVGEDRGIPFLAMPLLQGESLERRLQREYRLATAEVLRVGREAAEGLAAAHARGLIHRDVKPANIWLEAKGQERRSDEGPGPRAPSSPDRVLLLDFGLARAGGGQGSLTGVNLVVGTPAYVAPEQARGETADARSDLFSLGIVLYRMATGEFPARGRDLASRGPGPSQERPASPDEINPGVPPALAELILQLLSSSPSLRPASAGDVADRLRTLERPPAAPPSAEPARARVPPLAPPWPRPAGTRAWRRRGLAAAAGLSLFLTLGYVFGGAVIRFATNQGQVVIEVSDPDTEVTLKEGGAVIQDRKGQRQVTLAAGEHQLEVTVRDPSGEVRFFTTSFLLRRGGKEIVNIRQELARARPPAGTSSGPDTKPPGPPAPRGAAEAERRAALWVLGLGGEGVVLVGDGKKDLASARELQAGAFQVVNVVFGPASRPNDTDLEQLKDLPNLRSLKLQGAWVSDASLAHLGALKNLRRLDLVAARVSDAGLMHLQGLTNLEHLILIHVPVTDAGLENLKALRNLRNLALGGTRVTEAGMEHLRALPNLTGWLTLDNSGVSDAWLDRLKPLTWLTGLGLANNPVTDAGLASLEALPNLEEVNLSNTKVSDAGLVHLKGLRNLRWLRLAGTGVSDAGLANLKELGKLLTLDLRGTRVTDAGLEHLAGLTHLTELRLGCPGITDRGAVAVGRLKGLERLSLAGSGLTDAGLEALKGLSSLRELDLTGTRVTAGGVAALQKALPKCLIRSEPAEGK
jgi:serine/threonine protein kinase